MKVILALLLFASSAFAQHVVPLGGPSWYDARLDPAAVATEDSVFAEFEILSNLLPNIHWDLPLLGPDDKPIEPDSIVFIVRGTAEVYGFSTWNSGNLHSLGFTREAGRISFPYSKEKGRRTYRVGIAAHDRTREGDENVGGKGIDAAYAVYLPKLSVDPIERLLHVQQHNWYDQEGKWRFFGTRKELERSGLPGPLFSIEGKYYQTF